MPLVSGSKKSQDDVGVANKDLLRKFQDSIPAEDAKELLASLVDKNVDTPEEASSLQ